MAERVREVMTPNPVTLHDRTSLLDAAQAMRQHNIGDVIVVTEAGEVCGIVTDRDITIRAVADERDPRSTMLGEICSQEVVTVGPEGSIDEAVDLMRSRALRRLPVIEGGKPVGVVSIGDLAQDRDRKSALADISAAPANR